MHAFPQARFIGGERGFARGAIFGQVYFWNQAREFGEPHLRQVDLLAQPRPIGCGEQAAQRIDDGLIGQAMFQFVRRAAEDARPVAGAKILRPGASCRCPARLR